MLPMQSIPLPEINILEHSETLAVLVFFSNKNITCAEGGMLICDSETAYENAKLMRSHGMRRLSFDKSKGHQAPYDIEVLGYNYRMDDIRASLLLSQLNKLSADTKKTRARKRIICGSP